MKQLLLLRHAKSDWSNSVKDFDRPLNSRGRRVAPKMGKLISDEVGAIDVIHSSSSQRTRDTTQLVSEQLVLKDDSLRFLDDLYEAPIRAVLNQVNALNNDYDKVLMIGHNPTFSFLAEYLTGKTIGSMPTCSVVVISFDTNDWGEVSKDTGTLLKFLYPKMYDF